MILHDIIYLFIQVSIQHLSFDALTVVFSIMLHVGHGQKLVNYEGLKWIFWRIRGKDRLKAGIKPARKAKRHRLTKILLP